MARVSVHKLSSFPSIDKSQYFSSSCRHDEYTSAIDMPKKTRKKSYTKMMRDLVAPTPSTKKMTSSTAALGGGTFKKIDHI